MSTIMRYINDSLEELRHVRWPTRQQAIRLSAIVVGFTAVCGVVFGVIDFDLSEALRTLLNYAS